MVRVEGLEPSRYKAGDFKSPSSTIPTYPYNLALQTGLEPATIHPVGGCSIQMSYWSDKLCSYRRSTAGTITDGLNVTRYRDVDTSAASICSLK